MADTQSSSAELIAHYAALIQPWQRFLAEQRAEQQRLLQEMQAAHIEEELPEPSISAVTPPNSEGDPVRWLWNEDDPDQSEEAVVDPELPTEGGMNATSEEMAAATAPAPTASRNVTAATRVPLRVVEEALHDPGEAALVPDPLDPHLADAATTRAVIEAMETEAPDPFGVGELDGNDLSRLARMEESETEKEFRRALADTDEALLPLDLQSALEYGTQEEIARAFVRARRVEGLPDRLAAAVEQMEEEAFHFREAASLYENDDPSDDPEPYF